MNSRPPSVVRYLAALFGLLALACSDAKPRAGFDSFMTLDADGALMLRFDLQ